MTPAAARRSEDGLRAADVEALLRRALGGDTDVHRGVHHDVAADQPVDEARVGHVGDAPGHGVQIPSPGVDADHARHVVMLHELFGRGMAHAGGGAGHRDGQAARPAPP